MMDYSQMALVSDKKPKLKCLLLAYLLFLLIRRTTNFVLKAASETEVKTGKAESLS